MTGMGPVARSFVTQSAWGKALEPAPLERVLSTSREVVVRQHGYIVHAGEEARHWIGIVDGLAIQQVTSSEGKPAALTAACTGTWFGEGTLMKRGCWQYDVIARRETRLLLVPAETFHWLSETNLAFNRFIARLLNERLSHYMGLLANERLTEPEQRVARVLASLYDPDLYPRRPELLRMSQADIALLCGISRQRTNAALQKLQTAGFVELVHAGVKVMDVKALRTY